MSLIKAQFTPNLELLKRYIAGWELKTSIERGYAQLELALDEEQYQRYYDGLKGVIAKYNLSDFQEELLYIIFREDEILGDSLRNDKQRQDYLENTIEVSKFLLAFKNSGDNPEFQIGVKENVGTVKMPINKTHFIKSAQISSWMCQVIWDSIEAGNLPYGLVDEQSTENIFGSAYYGSQGPIKIENLERGANLENKKFSVYRRKRYVEFCYEIQDFLNEYTPLRTPQGIKITDQHANIFFDILLVLDYLNPEKIGSDPKDYIGSMIRKY